MKVEVRKNKGEIDLLKPWGRVTEVPDKPLLAADYLNINYDRSTPTDVTTEAFDSHHSGDGADRNDE